MTDADKIRRKIVEKLGKSRMGLSGLEISKAIGMNRVTLSKYLGILFAEGIIGQKHVGNAIVWFVQEGTDSFSFPDDYDTAAKKYLDLLLANSVNAAHHVIRNNISVIIFSGGACTWVLRLQNLQVVDLDIFLQQYVN